MPKEVLILGGGFAGLATAQRFERKIRDGEVNVTLISRDNYTLFTPMLPEVSSGGLEMRHIVTPLRAELRRTKFVLGEVEHIDPAAQRIDVMHSISEHRASYHYDHLVFGLGAVTSTFNIPGVSEHTLPLKTLEDAEELRNHIIATLELADVVVDPAQRKRMLTYVIVGGGYTGVEAAGELIDLFSSISKFYRSIKRTDISMSLVEGGKALLPDLPQKMGKYSAKNLKQRGVEVVLEDLVTEVDNNGLTLKSGRRFESATIIWSAGSKPTPLMADLDLERTRHGALRTNPDMSLPGHPGLWAIGDCASIPSGGDKPYPATAQHAIREGPVLADNILASVRGNPTKPFKYMSLGTMASLGARRGVAQLPGDFVITGFIAWFLWRTYYLSRLPGLDRKVRVAFDWLIGLFFPRDIAELRVFTERSRLQANKDAGMTGRGTVK